MEIQVLLITRLPKPPDIRRLVSSIQFSAMNSVLITGGNRGVGLGIIKALTELKSAPKHIVATCRESSNSDELKQLAGTHSNIKILHLESTDFASYEPLATTVSSIVGEEGLNVLINNAGISEKFGRIGMVKADKLQQSFIINTVAPIMMSKAMVPLLKKAADFNKGTPLSPSRALIVNMSSILGSISTNKEGGFYSYKCSKAALNMATTSLAIDLKQSGVMCISIHPGWIKTAMGGPNAPLTTDQACPQLVNTIASLNEEHNGKYIDYLGKGIPW